MACKFIKYNEELEICDICGYIASKGSVREDCRYIFQEQYQGPDFLQKVKNFTRAVTGHLANGNPTVTEEQLKKRLEICKTCVLFKPTGDGVGGTCLHNSCGCSIKDTLEYMNKIAWADQECPVGKWGKEST